jgi:NADH-quinone oxidoreductase subunit J
MLAIHYIFFVFAAMAVLFSVVAIAHRSPVINVLGLVGAFFAVAAIYAMVGMDFLAAIQIIVYSGAILVLFLFVIMLLNLERVERLGSSRPVQAVLGVAIALGIGIITVYAISLVRGAPGAVLPGSEDGTVFPIGRALMTTHLLPFEFISVLLLAALVGAFVLAKRELQ